MVPDWFLDGSLMVLDWFLIGSWIVPNWFLTGSCLVLGWFLMTERVRSLAAPTRLQTTFEKRSKEEIVKKCIFAYWNIFSPELPISLCTLLS
jgi:hypothetical protein